MKGSAVAFGKRHRLPVPEDPNPPRTVRPGGRWYSDELKAPKGPLQELLRVAGRAKFEAEVETWAAFNGPRKERVADAALRVAGERPEVAAWLMRRTIERLPSIDNTRRHYGRAANAPSQAVRCPRAEDLAEDARRLRAEGLAVAEICRRIGRKKTQVYQYLTVEGSEQPDVSGLRSTTMSSSVEKALSAQRAAVAPAKGRAVCAGTSSVSSTPRPHKYTDEPERAENERSNTRGRWEADRKAALRVFLEPRPDSITEGEWTFAQECAVSMAEKGATGETIRAALASVFDAVIEGAGTPAPGGSDPVFFGGGALVLK